MFSAIKKTFAACAVCAMLVAAVPGTALADVSHDGAVHVETGQPTLDSIDGNSKRNPEGEVSSLNPNSYNPYNKQIRLYVDVGAEFATYDGSEVSEGYIVNCNSGDVITLPVVKAKPGYTFVGWGQGGIPAELDWDVFVREVKISDDTSDGDQTAIFAIYADTEGNAYCTCGAYEAGKYSDQMGELEAKYAEYLAEYGKASAQIGSPWRYQAISTIVILLAAALIFVPVSRAFAEDERKSQNP